MKIAGPLAAIALALIAGAAFISFIGKDPFPVYLKLLDESLGSSYGVGQVLFKATPLIFTGLAAAFSLKRGYLTSVPKDSLASAHFALRGLVMHSAVSIGL